MPAPSAVVVAPTGQGKTYLIRKMAECVGLNTIIVDCGTLAAEGWKGIAVVESESTICKVILDTNGDGCCIHYEHGPRDYSFYDSSKAKECHWETVKEANVSGLVNKLYRYYRLSDASLIARPQVKTFLDCALTFLLVRCRPSERTFESLEKLARSTNQSGRTNSPPLEIIMMDGLEAKTVSNSQVQRFKNAYTPQMQQNLVEALQIIMTAIRAELGPCQVKFDVLKLPEQQK